jgi:hypothetical protein
VLCALYETTIIVASVLQIRIWEVSNKPKMIQKLNDTASTLSYSIVR